MGESPGISRKSSARTGQGPACQRGSACHSRAARATRNRPANRVPVRRRVPAAPLRFVFQPSISRMHVHRQPTFSPQIVPGIFVSRDQELAIQLQAAAQFAGKGLGFVVTVAVVLGTCRQTARHFARSVHRHAAKNNSAPNAAVARRDTICLGPSATGRPVRIGPSAVATVVRPVLRFMGPTAVGPPLVAFHVVDRNKCRFAAHRQTHVVVLQIPDRPDAPRPESSATVDPCTAWSLAGLRECA